MTGTAVIPRTDAVTAITKPLADRTAFIITFTTRMLVDRMSSSFKDDVARELIEALPSELHERYVKSHENPRAIGRSLGVWLKNRNGRWAGDHVCDRDGHDGHLNVPLWRIRCNGE